MPKADAPQPAANVPQILVVSRGCTTVFPDLALQLLADQPTPIPESALTRVLSQPQVSRHPQEA